MCVCLSICLVSLISIIISHHSSLQAIAFYLGAKVALVLLFLLLALPLSPIQIIILELFMDVGASTTFTIEPADDDLMHKPPRNPKVGM